MILVANTRPRRAAFMSSIRICRSRMAALRRVDQRVEPAAVAVDRLEQARHLVFARHVRLHLHRVGLAAGRRDARHHCLGGGAVGQVVDAYGVGALGRQQGDGRVDAASGAGDQDDFVIHDGSRKGRGSIACAGRVRDCAPAR